MKRILVIEDDISILNGLRDVLTFKSYDVLTAVDGEEGYAAALKERMRGKTSRPNSSIERRSSSTPICPELNTRSTTPTPVSA